MPAGAQLGDSCCWRRCAVQGVHEISYDLTIPLPGVSKELKAETQTDACMSVITAKGGCPSAGVCAENVGSIVTVGYYSTLERNEIQVLTV